MILCDIGNSNVDFFNDGKIWSLSVDEFETFVPQEKIYFINVNPRFEDKLQKDRKFIDIRSYFSFDTIYQGIGIDRIAACYTIKDGIIVDAGSAITVDVMNNSVHLGGYILPGINAYEKCYASISTLLAKKINPNTIIDALPQRTDDAVSYGAIKSILLMLKDTCKDKQVYFTGGDGQFFSKFFKKSIYDRALVFRGMKKVIEEKGLEC
ncbi:type III pantothenate kinase [Sulfurospirillum sp. 1307]|jgi:type III pantothenate kinase